MDEYTSNTSNPKGRLIRRISFGFFAGMAALTLFSNTIVNYSLPRVQVKNFESGVISRQIQTEGTVSASLQHTLNFGAARTVDQVKVEVGSPVLAGDVLATLKPTDGLELLEMEKAYENAQLDLARMKDTAASVTVPAMEKAVKSAEKAVAAALKDITVKEAAVKAAEDALDTAVDQAQYQLDLAEADRDYKEDQRDGYKDPVTQLFPVTGDSDYADYLAAQHDFELAQDEVNDKQDALEQAQDAADDASDQESVQTAQEALAAAHEAHTDSLAALAQAQSDLAAAKKTDAQTVKDRGREITKAENNLLIQKKKLDQFKATQNVNQIVADANGRISKLALTPGGVINPSEAIATIDAAEARYELKAALPAEQASVLVIGDRADVMMGSMGWAQATLREIREDKDQPGQVKQLIFDVDGEVTLGQQVTLSIYKTSRQYEIIVPNAAVRQDANGTFILIMRQKNGPLGSRFTLERISTTVLESDSTRSAVSATLDWGVPVVTAANKAVEAGSRVLPTK